MMKKGPNCNEIPQLQCKVMYKAFAYALYKSRVHIRPNFHGISCTLRHTKNVDGTLCRRQDWARF